MSPVSIRVLALFVLVGAMVMSALVLSENAAAASVSGTWGSRIAGEGYTQTYMGPYGVLVTDEFDVELSLSESGGEVYGTLRSWNQYGTQEYSVTGTVSGSTFYMTAYYGWDGVNYLTPVYTLTIDGNRLYGSGSYVNVGVTINGYFDLEKEGLFAVGGITPVVSAVSITIAIVAIVVAASPAGVSPKGRQPQVSRLPSQGPGYEPSRQWTTDTPHQQAPWGEATPVGGVGLHYPPAGTSGAVRPMTPPESAALQGISKPLRNNAIGISVLSMVMAVMVNFVEDMVALIMPLFFCVVGLGLAVQARAASGAVAQAVAKGTVTEARVTPKRRRGGSWDFGAFSAPGSKQMDGVMTDGVPVTVAIVPEAKRLVSVNMVTLTKPVQLTAPAGFESRLAMHAAPEVSYQVPDVPEDDLPPPPDEWRPSVCPQCGTVARSGGMFCERCGHKLGP